MAGWLARLAGPRLQQMSQNLASSTHMDRTANLERSEISSDAIVTDISQLSPTVKRFQLQVLNKHVTFKAGQWVDVTIPSVSIVGGYSMCSTPLTLQTEGVLELAVKYSDHPPAKWMHSHCSVSDCLHLRVGGDFTYSPQPGSTASNLFLVAGGVGINPLLAMLKHHMELWSADHWNNTLPAIPKVCLLYSAREEGELLFKSQIDDLLHSHGDVLLVKYFVTKEKPEMRSNTLQAGRMSQDDVLEGIKFLAPDLKPVNCYVCGPPPLIDSVVSYIAESGVPKRHVHFEKWW